MGLQRYALKGLIQGRRVNSSLFEQLGLLQPQAANGVKETPIPRIAQVSECGTPWMQLFTQIDDFRSAVINQSDGGQIRWRYSYEVPRCVLGRQTHSDK